MEYKQLDANTGELKFYGNISEWWINGEDFNRTLSEMAGKFNNIHVRVHCYGGSVFEGVVMQTALKRCKSKVIFFIDGVAASMITQVMLDADEVRISENAFVMVHSPSTYISGTAKQLSEAARLLASMEKNFARNYARKTGKSEKEVQKWFDGNDYWFSADEAKAEGLVDEIEEPVVSNIVTLDKPTEQGQAEQVFSRFAALFDVTNQENSIENNNNMKKELIAKFNLTGVTEASTDAEIQAALQAKFDEAKESGKTQMKAAVEAVIAGVEKATGKTYDAGIRAQLVTVGETSGLETLQAMLGLNAPAVAAATPAAQTPSTATPAVPTVVNLMQTGATTVADERKGWTWDEWQEKDPDGVEALEKSNPEAFKALYKAKFGTVPNMNL